MPAVRDEPRTLRSVAFRPLVARALPNVLRGVVLPTAMFYATLPHFGVWAALVATTLASSTTVVWRMLRARRIGGLLMLTATTSSLRLVTAIAARNPAMYFLQPIIAKLVVAGALVGSRRTHTPLLRRLAEDFIELPHDDPELRRFVDRASAGWAAVLVLHSAVAGWMLWNLPVEVYVAAKTFVNVAFKGGAVAATLAGYHRSIRRRESSS